MPQIVMPSIRAKGSPSMIIRSAKVPLSPSSALHTTYLRSAAVSATVFHLMPVGKPAPPRPRKPGFRHFGNDRLRADRDGLCKPAPAAMRGVIGKRERIDDAAAGEGEARLGCKERMIFRFADPKGVRAAGDKARLEEGSEIGG